MQDVGCRMQIAGGRMSDAAPAALTADSSNCSMSTTMPLETKARMFRTRPQATTVSARPNQLQIGARRQHGRWPDWGWGLEARRLEPLRLATLSASHPTHSGQAGSLQSRGYFAS